MSQDKSSSKVPDTPEVNAHSPERHEGRGCLSGRGRESAVASTQSVLVSELNGIFACVPRLGNDAEPFERDIADALTVITEDRDPWKDSCG
jgi:hypothetical protein